MKTPLLNEDQVCQKAFALTTQIVVHHIPSVEHFPDEGQDWIGEIASIGPDELNLETEEEHYQDQQQNGKWAILSVGWREQEHDRQLRVATQQGIHFVAEGRAFPGLGKAPVGIKIVLKLGRKHAGVQKHIHTPDDAHARKLPDHAQKEEPKRQDA